MSGPWNTSIDVAGFLPYFPLKFSTLAHTTRGPVVGEFFSLASHSLFRPSVFSPVTRVCCKIEKKFRPHTVLILCSACSARLMWTICRTTRPRDYIINFFMAGNRNERDVYIIMMSCVFYTSEYPYQFLYTYINRGQYNSSRSVVCTRSDANY